MAAAIGFARSLLRYNGVVRMLFRANESPLPARKRKKRSLARSLASTTRRIPQEIRAQCENKHRVFVVEITTENPITYSRVSLVAFLARASIEIRVQFRYVSRDGSYLSRVSISERKRCIELFCNVSCIFHECVYEYSKRLVRRVSGIFSSLTIPQFR